MSKLDKPDGDAVTKKVGLQCEIVFVPWPQSRSGRPEGAGFIATDDLNLNWKAIFWAGKAAVTADYSQGIYCIPGAQALVRKDGWTIYTYNAVKRACFEGKGYIHGGVLGTNPFFDRPLPKPAADEILHALVHDAEVLNYSGFEAWAGDCGFDPDSRKAEKIYNECRDIALRLRALVGVQAFDELPALLSEYD